MTKISNCEFDRIECNESQKRDFITMKYVVFSSLIPSSCHVEALLKFTIVTSSTFLLRINSFIVIKIV